MIIFKYISSIFPVDSCIKAIGRVLLTFAPSMPSIKYGTQRPLIDVCWIENYCDLGTGLGARG